MNAFTAAKRVLLPLFCGALLAAGPALAGDAGYLGVRLQDLSPAMAKALQLGDRSGVLVSEVVDDGPAAKAGLADGDVIIAFAGKSLSDYGSLTEAVRAAKPGDKVDVTVLRDGKQQTIEVELGEAEDAAAWTFKSGDDDATVFLEHLQGDDDEFEVRMQAADRGWLGVHIDDLGPQLGEYFGIEDGKGALVTEVEADSPAAKAGLKAGDVIVKLGDQDVADTDDLHEALAGTEAEQEVDVRYVRKGKQQKADVTLGETPAGDLRSLHFFGDDGEFHVTVPKMMRRHLAPMAGRGLRAPRDPQRHIEIIREMGEAGTEMKQMREELDAMRQELDKLREELKK